MDKMTLIVKAEASNESFARTVIAAFAARENPTVNIISDIKTAISEAVTNAVIHAYNGNNCGEICIKASIEDRILKVEVTDYGKGIVDIIEAMSDFYTTLPGEERSGLGFTIMGSFMDSLDVKSVLGEGTTVSMTKRLT
ncbi:MAG: anti-sigma F factor [Clostridia bacterium]